MRRSSGDWPPSPRPASPLTRGSAFDIPVYWPILLVYFVLLFVLTMKKEMTKWYQLGYVPWSAGKKTYV